MEAGRYRAGQWGSGPQGVGFWLAPIFDETWPLQIPTPLEVKLWERGIEALLFKLPIAFSDVVNR